MGYLRSQISNLPKASKGLLPNFYLERIRLFEVKGTSVEQGRGLDVEGGHFGKGVCWRVGNDLIITEFGQKLCKLTTCKYFYIFNPSEVLIIKVLVSDRWPNHQNNTPLLNSKYLQIIFNRVGYNYVIGLEYHG